MERSLSWIMWARRHCRDYERLPQHSEALITWASITLMTRRSPALRHSGTPALRHSGPNAQRPAPSAQSDDLAQAV
ncbi:hypothetical protein SGFS_004380 [Streptomyces graminofaciens]|uniref:Transposase n=1 Tax=Streptomyces graminofaciens TaxID=68212 RepID=A0ABM7F0D4_9ACTN|nr:hypothetical protein SGFS_004380 [Streptomyces graminofaciens]